MTRPPLDRPGVEVLVRLVVDEALVRQLHAESCDLDGDTPELDSYRQLVVAGALAAELSLYEGATARVTSSGRLEVLEVLEVVVDVAGG